MIKSLESKFNEMRLIKSAGYDVKLLAN